MSNQVVAFKGANLPSVQSLATALRSVSSDTLPGGVAILKMGKDGYWVYGADQTEVENGSVWAVNPYSFVHGYIAWGDGEVLGEKMVGIAHPLPELTEAPPASKKGWERQIGVSLKCMEGSDAGLEVRYSTTSVGGRRAVEELATAIAAQVDADAEHPVAVVKLGKGYYMHKSFGKIYTPVFEIAGWASLNGELPLGDDADQPEEVEEAPQPQRRRRA